MAGMRDYTDDELALVRKSFSARYALQDRCFFEMALQTGLRVSEMLSLTVGQVYQYGKVADEVSIERKHMKGGQGRQSQRSHHTPLPRDTPPYPRLAAAPGGHAQGEGLQGHRSLNPALSLTHPQ
jgi:integrase